MHVPKAVYDRIAEQIRSADSPVGIDAEKAHVTIIHMLTEIDRRLRNLEEQARNTSRGL